MFAANTDFGESFDQNFFVSSFYDGPSLLQGLQDFFAEHAEKGHSLAGAVVEFSSTIDLHSGKRQTQLALYSSYSPTDANDMAERYKKKDLDLLASCFDMFTAPDVSSLRFFIQQDTLETLQHHPLFSKIDEKMRAAIDTAPTPPMTQPYDGPFMGFEKELTHEFERTDAPQILVRVTHTPMSQHNTYVTYALEPLQTPEQIEKAAPKGGALKKEEVDAFLHSKEEKCLTFTVARDDVIRTVFQQPVLMLNAYIRNRGMVERYNLFQPFARLFKHLWHGLSHSAKNIYE